MDKIKQLNSRMFWKIARGLIRSKPGDVPQKPKRILLMRYGFLGDVLLTTPVVRVLKKIYPDAEIDYWVSNHAKKALFDNPWINDILSADLGGFPNVYSLRYLYNQIKAIKKKKYDFVVILSQDAFWSILAWMCGIPYRIGIVNDIRKTILLNVSYVVPEKNNENQLASFFKLLAKSGIDGLEDEYKIDLYWKEEDERVIDELIECTNCRLVAVFAGGGQYVNRPWVERKWPLENWVELCRQLLEKYEDIRLVFIGTMQEKKICESIMKKLPQARIADFIDKITINQLGILLKKSCVLISHDSSPVFIAAGVGCPVVVLYGPEWPERTKPPGVLWAPVYIEIACRTDCVAYGKHNNCQNACIKNITIASVAEKVSSVIG